MIAVLYEKVSGFFAKACGFADQRIFDQELPVQLPAVRKLPRRFVCRGIVFIMFNVPSPLQYKCFQSFFAQFFGCPSAGNA
jgi:hypothetical protein